VTQDSKTFVYDPDAPLSYVQYPPASLVKKVRAATLTEVSGTAMDALAGMPANPANVEVSFQEVSPNTAYWNGTTFTLTTEQFFAVNLMDGLTWRRNVLPILQNGFTYRIRVRARDNAKPVGTSRRRICRRPRSFMISNARPRRSQVLLAIRSPISYRSAGRPKTSSTAPA